MTLTQWAKKVGRPILTPDDVAAERDSTSGLGQPKTKARKARPDPRYKAQYQYQRECVACRTWMRDNLPDKFRKLCRKVGRRRPTYRIFKKRRKANGTTSEKDSGTSGAKD